MDASARPGQAVRRAVLRRSRRSAAALLLALLIALATGALLLSSLTENASAHAPAGAPAAPLDDTPTPTSTPPLGPPTLTVVSPSSETGPVGAKVTIAGDNWSGTVNVGAVLSPGDCSNKSGWAKSFGSPKANGSHHLSFSFTWPSSLNQTSTPYSICATNSSGTASVNYQVASPTAPVIAFSVDSAQVGVLLTINGSNFLGAGPITISAQGPTGDARLVTTVTPLDNGTFSVPFTPTVRDVGSVTIRAASASEGGAPAAISTSSKLQVVAAPTATATLGPTPTTASSVGPGVPTSNNGDNSAATVVLIVVGILFALLAIGGVGVFLLVRQRGVPGGPDGGDPAFYGPGSQPGGYDPYAPTAYGATPPSGYPSGGQYGRSGFGSMPGAYPGGSQAGGVASWDDADDAPTEEDAGPGPDWHPRPMTGHYRAPDASDYRTGQYGPGTVDPRDAAGFAPPDPWANDDADPYGTNRAPAGNYGASRPGPGTNIPPHGGSGQQRRNPWGESWRDAPPNQQGGYPRQPGNGNGEDPDDPNGYTGW